MIIDTFARSVFVTKDSFTITVLAHLLKSAAEKCKFKKQVKGYDRTECEQNFAIEITQVKPMSMLAMSRLQRDWVLAME